MIYITAYFANNFGDDLFVRYLLRRYPTEKFYLCASNPMILQCFRTENNAVIICRFKSYYLRLKNRLTHYKGPFRDYRNFRKADAVVRIGGSVFIESEGWKERYSYGQGNNLFILGANFGPYYTEEYKKAVESIISNSLDCCFRDKYSYEMFSSLKQTRYAPDILFGYPEGNTEPVSDCIGVSIIDCSDRKKLSQYTTTYETGMADICNYYMKNGKRIKLFSFCSSEGDKNAAEHIRSHLNDPAGADVIEYTGNIDEFMQEFCSCSLIIATRFHAMILGWKLGKRVFPVVYSDKQAHVIRDLNYQGVWWDFRTGDAVPVDMLDGIEPLNDEIIDCLNQASAGHFRELDEFVNGVGNNDDHRTVHSK